MVGEPSTPTKAFFDAFEGAVDATPLLVEARTIKTEQEIERMRLANELAALAMEHVREHLRPGMTEAEAAALWEGHVHAVGVGYKGKVGMARGYSLVWSGPGIRTFTATGHRPVQAHEPTLFEIWVCADGYWCDHTKNLCPGELRARVRRAAGDPARRLRGGSIHRRRRRTAPRDRSRHPGSHRRGRLSGPAHASGLPRRGRPRARAALRSPGGHGIDSHAAWCSRSNRRSSGQAGEA